MASLQAGVNATRDKLKFAMIMTNPARVEKIVAYFLARGTHIILNADVTTEYAGIPAAFALYFEEYIATHLRKIQPLVDYRKIFELQHQKIDNHTVVGFLRKRIPCSCLDEIYKEVKRTTKMGICANDNCGLPFGRVERHAMLQCNSCRRMYYCSQECQAADWPFHRKHCRSSKSQA